MADEHENTKPYELLDSGASINGRLHVFGAKIELTKEQADTLEPFGSVRPWGEDDHNLVDDERDIPGMLANAAGREQLARLRREKRGHKSMHEEKSPAVEDFAEVVSNVAGPDPVLAAAPEAPHQRGAQGREKTSGRRG